MKAKIHIHNNKTNTTSIWTDDLRLVQRPRYAFHTTTVENALRILKFGMVIRPNERTWFFFSTKGARRYLSVHLSLDNPQTTSVALCVNTTLLKNKFIANDLNTNEDEPLDAFVFCPKSLVFIPPNSIRLYATLFNNKEFRKLQKIFDYCQTH